MLKCIIQPNLTTEQWLIINYSLDYSNAKDLALKWCLQYVCGMHSLKMYIKVNFSNVVSHTFLKAIHQHEQCLEA